MILTPADCALIADAFQDRVGPTALPASTTVSDLCQNLVLAIPSLLETCALLTEQRDSLEQECENLAATAEGLTLERQNFHAEADLRLRGELAEANRKIKALEERLKEDPCP